MKKALIKASVLAAVFLLSLVIFGSFMNQEQLDLTTEMAGAALPVIVLYDENAQINELHGYTVQMNATGMRDTITPVSSSREIPLQIKTYGYQVDSVTYEIRSIDGERLISDGTITSFQEENGQIQTSIPVQSLLEQTKEYILTFKIRQGEDICYYYTRIADGQDCYVKECVQFAQQVNELTFSEKQDELSTYWEPNETGDNSSLHKVTINSSLSQAGWADLDCARLTTPVPSVKEMNNSYNVILLDYVVTAKGSGEEVEYYNVEEYYRIRYTSERIYLLNFERTMNQIFNGENDFLYENYLQLGIRSEEVEYMQNETGTITCFVQEGELWSYNQNTNRLAEVFSFRGHERMDVRENYTQHDIHILSVDEAGVIDYVVYGYMNRGVHEGRVGISFMHYDSQANTNEEKLFITFDKSYEMLKSELGKLLYANTSGGIYLLFNGTVYHGNLVTLEMSEAAEGLEEGLYAVSESNRFLAWVSDDASREITIMDLETSRTQQIRTKKNKTLRVLGFLQEDLVYGIAADKHKTGSAAGIVQSPMYSMRIIDASNGELLKEYRKKGYYVDSVEINDGVLIIQRLSEGENGYVQARQDSIVNRNRDTDEQEIVHTTNTETRQTQVQLTLAQPEPKNTPVYLAAKLVMNQEEKEAALESEQEEERYYAYARGKIQLASADAAEAVKRADETMGVVVDAQQNYIWKRARKIVQQPLDMQVSEADRAGSAAVKCVSAMLKNEGVEVSVSELFSEGETPQQILESLLPERKVIHIKGCSLSQVLYYVNCGTPVLAGINTQQAVLVTGYDTLNVWIYDPQTDSTIRKTIEEAETEFAAAGGIYMAYQ